MNTTNHNRRKRTGYCYKTSARAYVECFDDDFDYCLQVARSVGMSKSYNHPEIGMLININPRPYSNYLLEHILYRISQGALYKDGDVIDIRLTQTNELYTVKFKSIQDENEPVLRAIVLNLEEEFQTLSAKDALRYIQTASKDI